MAGPVGVVVADLIEMAAESFDVGRWFVDAGGFQRRVLDDPGVAAVCGRFGVSLIGLAAAESVGS